MSYKGLLSIFFVKLFIKNICIIQKVFIVLRHSSFNGIKKQTKTKTMTITKKGQYASSNETFEGSKREVLSYLRAEALTMREQSRQVMPKSVRNVHAILKNKHSSELVNLATYKLKELGIDQLLPLMNVHGVFNYSMQTKSNTILTYNHTKNLFSRNEFKPFVNKYFKDVKFLGTEYGNWNPQIVVSNWSEVKNTIPKYAKPFKVN